jgi:hypothetical protein
MQAALFHFRQVRQQLCQCSAAQANHAVEAVQ